MNTTVPLQEASDLMMVARVVLSLLFVVALIYLSSAIARKYGLDKRIAGVKKGEPTMAVVETLYLDPRRKLVRVRVDAKEHVLLLAPTGDVLVSSHDAEAQRDKV